MVVKSFDFSGRQRPVVDADVVDLAFEINICTLSDPQRRRVRRIFFTDATQINQSPIEVNTFNSVLAIVVSSNNMMPSTQRRRPSNLSQLLLFVVRLLLGLLFLLLHIIADDSL